MIECSIYICYFLLVITLNILEYKIYKTIFNPFAVLSIPFSVVVFICICFNKNLDFVEFSYITLYPWILGLVIFWTSGRFVGYIFMSSPVEINTFKKEPDNSNKLILFIISLVCLFFLIKFRSLSNSVSMGTKDFGEEFMLGGLAGRLSNCLMIFFPYLIYTKCNKFFKIILLFFIFIFILSYASKTWLMGVFIVSIFIGILQKRINLNPKIIILTLVGGISLFILYYSFTIDNDVLFDFVFRHFYFYLTSGVLGLNEFFEEKTFFVSNNDYLILPFVNFINTIFLGKQALLPHSSLWYCTDLLNGTETNVYTFFGTLYIYGDWVFMAIYTFVLGFMTYLFFYLAKKSNNIFINILNAYNLSILFFAWYNFAYNLLRYWEIFTFCIFFFILSKVRLSFKRNFLD